MEIKKMRMVCPTAVYFGRGSGVDPCPSHKKGAATAAEGGNRVLKRETQHQGEPLVWYRVELSRMQGTSKNMRAEHILKKNERRGGRLSQKIN